MKPLLSMNELIIHMQNKGIKFNIVNEEDAITFLSSNNYYMKLSSYRFDYQKNPKNGQYINLDFAYLKELSTIDMHLRYLIIEMCLDIEHIIKVKLLNDITNNPKEDGYNVIKKFLAGDANHDNFKILKSIHAHKSGEYCKDLIEKYYPYFPAWVFVELISFGDLMYLCDFYKNLYNVSFVNNKLMNTVRDIRNAAAHSNCLINNLFDKMDDTKEPDSSITTFVLKMPGISSQARGKNLHFKFTYSFITLLYVYDQLMPEISKKKKYAQLYDFIHGRAVQNKDYFVGNSRIKGAYYFIQRVIDNLYNGTYN